MRVHATRDAGPPFIGGRVQSAAIALTDKSWRPLIRASLPKSARRELGGDAALAQTYAADDFPAIARRMREIAEERQQVEGDQGSPLHNPSNGLERLRRSPSQADDTRRSGIRWSDHLRLARSI